VPVCVSAAEWQQVPNSLPSGGHNRRVVVGRAWNVDQVVDSSVHKHKLTQAFANLPHWPEFEILQNGALCQTPVSCMSSLHVV